jgi:hypothetical protein
MNKNSSREITVIKFCKECRKEFSYKSRKLNNTIVKFFCSKSCATKFNYRNMSDKNKIKRLENIKKTNFQKYGDEYVINSKYAREKTKEKTGFAYSFQNDSIQLKCKNSLIENTGYDNPMKNNKTVQKMKKTKIEKYGDFLIPMSKYKDYIFPSGKSVKIQGNEGKALDILILKYDEIDIFVGRRNIEIEIGKIYYIDKSGEKHIYYPDIYIKSENKIYEVKSQFTYNIHKEINELKKEACIEKKLNFEFLILN